MPDMSTCLAQIDAGLQQKELYCHNLLDPSTSLTSLYATAKALALNGWPKGAAMFLAEAQRRQAEVWEEEAKEQQSKAEEFKRAQALVDCFARLVDLPWEGKDAACAAYVDPATPASILYTTADTYDGLGWPISASVFRAEAQRRKLGYGSGKGPLGKVKQSPPERKGRVVKEVPRFPWEIESTEPQPEESSQPDTTPKCTENGQKPSDPSVPCCEGLVVDPTTGACQKSAVILTGANWTPVYVGLAVLGIAAIGGIVWALVASGRKAAPAHNPFSTRVTKWHREQFPDGIEAIGGMARAAWVVEWARIQEEKGRSLADKDIDVAAPRTPHGAIVWAQITAIKIAAANDILRWCDDPYWAMQHFYEEAIKYGGKGSAKDFGFVIGMQAIGSGVRWTNDNPDFGMKVPENEYVHGVYR